MMKAMFDRFLFGGDWNPEQWDESTWERDIVMLEHAHINEATINVFSWTQLQPESGRYDFATLDRIIALLQAHHFGIVLATSTAAVPAWMSREFPEVMRAGADGVRRVFGGRHNFCPNSSVFRKFSHALAGELSRRYAGMPGLLVWHIGNEYGGGGGMCYCDRCAEAFREWLRDKYGSVAALNEAWCANFWSHTVTDWRDVVPPSEYADGIGTEKAVISGLLMDYRRFQNDSQLACFINEREAIREFDATTPVTTNLMGAFKDLDYFQWGREMDVVSWDNYPGMDTEPSYTAMCHDLMRGVGGGKPFMLMEQTPNQQNWFPYCKVKRPGEVRALSWQAVAHGADTVQFFQLKQSLGGCERFHGAVIGHDGSEETRVFRQSAALGEELKDLGRDVMGAQTRSAVAVIFDWESYWSLESCVGPTTGFSYPQEVHRFYRALHKLNIPVDIIASTTPLEEMRRYTMVVAPALIMIKPGVARTLEAFVEEGGHLVTGYMSGLHDEHDLVIPGGYPGPLRELCGVWVEEIDGLAPEELIPVVFNGDGTTTQGTIVASIMHLEGAEAVADYGGEDFYAGTPAVSANAYGDGRAYYVGTPLDERGMDMLIKSVIRHAGVESTETPDGVELCRRYGDDGRVFTFTINLTGAVRGDMQAYEVRVTSDSA
ncbi:MAG: beta-galactosidase [Bifidobacterium psychraerophilum]|uniref:beta-galactosidase n=1 Tax=Bifidobacterium psychraerophilum TaxID=218140 RepID=UPI0039EA9465